MKALVQRILYFILAYITISDFLSCRKANNIICGPCPQIASVIPHIRFRVVDKITGNDLFFGISAKYKPMQIQSFHFNNGKLDTLFLAVDTIGHTFFMGIAPLHNKDTVTMQIANLVKDTFIFNTESIGKCCPNLVLNNVTNNGNIIYSMGSGPDVVVLVK